MVHRGLIISSAAQHRVPAIFTYRQFVREGALVAYGPETTDIFLRSASYVDRILKGANRLPAQIPNKFELAINVQTTRRLALKELLKKKQSGQKMEAPREREPSKVVNFMDALRRSVETERAGGERRKPAPRAGDHRAPKRAGRSSSRAKKAG